MPVCIYPPGMAKPWRSLASARTGTKGLKPFLVLSGKKDDIFNIWSKGEKNRASSSGAGETILSEATNITFPPLLDTKGNVERTLSSASFI